MSEIVKSNQSFAVEKVNIEGTIPSLNEATEYPIDLCGRYWTPENANENKRLYFVEIKSHSVLSADGSGELIELDCAVFLEPPKEEGGTVTTVLNGSRQLVGILEQMHKKGMIVKGTPLSITYLGKKKNKSNSYQSDNWSIKPLKLSID